MKLLESLNAINSNYINNLADKGIIYLLDYPTYNGEVVEGEKIQISGNIEYVV